MIPKTAIPVRFSRGAEFCWSEKLGHSVLRDSCFPLLWVCAPFLPGVRFDRPMVVGTQKSQVIERSCAAFLPGFYVVGFAVWFCYVASGERAPLIPVSEGITEVLGDCSGGSSQV